MIWLCIGTSGELIKVYSIIHYCRERGIPWRVLATGQSGVHFRKQWRDFELPEEHLLFLTPSEADLKSSLQALAWFVRSFFRSAGSLRRSIDKACGRVPDPAQDVWIVHGDTLSSMVGAAYGKRLGVRVAHVESGMTSGSVFEPFPEELCRRWTSRRADFCFAPDEEALRYLERRRLPGRLVCTGGNTLKDSVRIITQAVAVTDLPTKPYALVNVHRYENLHSSARWEKIAGILLRAAERTRLVIVLHPGTEEKIRSDARLRTQLERRGAVLLARKPFSQFIHFVANAEFLLSDGGSNQQESSYLGVPCLILRERTESREGMGGNCVLSELQDEVVERFLADPSQHRIPAGGPADSPTEVIMRELHSDPRPAGSRSFSTPA